MELKVLQQEFAVCKVKELSECDLRGEFCFVGKTDEEHPISTFEIIEYFIPNIIVFITV